jgi:hypothetical protein
LGQSGEFNDQGDAEWIVIRRQLKGHNDTPCGQPGVFGVLVTINQ